MADIEGWETASFSSTTATTASTSPESGEGRAAERHQLCAPPAAANAEEIERHNFQFGIREQIAYHAIREQALARLSRLLTGVQVFLGTSAIASLSDLIPVAPVYSVISSALAGVVLLVIDPSGGARDHRALRSRFHNILADFEEIGEDMTRLPLLKAKGQRTSADAPPAYRVVQAVAYNNAVNATYRESDAVQYRYHISLFRRIFANWFPMRGYKFNMETKSG